MDDQNSLEKQRRRKLEALQAQRNINPAGVTNVAKLPNTTTNSVVVNPSAFDAHSVYGAQHSSQNKLAKLPNVSQILSVSNESAQTVPMNGAQPLPPISTVAGGSCTPNFTNMGAYSGVGLPNMANVALPIGVQLGETDAKHNTNETDPNSLPIGVVSVPNVNFVPVHVGEMSLFADANGSVCAAPSGFHMPFHVPFSGIISIPSAAIMATQIDGTNSNAQGMSNMGVGMGGEQKVESAPVQAQPPPPPPPQQQQQQPQYGVQLSNAQALFSSSQSPALFGAQMPTFAAAFVSQPIAFIGPSAVNVGSTMSGVNPIAIATQNSMSMGMPNHSCATQQHVDANQHHLGSLSTSAMHSQSTHMQVSTQEQPSTSPSLVEPPSTVDKPRRGRRPGLNYGKRQAKVAMRMSSLDEVFALFTESKPQNATNEASHAGDANRQLKGAWPKSNDSIYQSSSLYDDTTRGGSDGGRRMKAKRANRTDPGSNQLQDTGSTSAERLNSTLDDDFMELLRSVVENDGAGASTTDVSSQRKSAPVSSQPTSSQPNRAGIRQKRPRVCLNEEQRTALETAFSQSGRLSRKRVTLIAARVGLPESAVIKCYAARRRKLKLARDAMNAGADVNDPTALKRRPLRGKTGPTTNFMSCLDDTFFNNVIGDQSAVCKSSRDHLHPTRNEQPRASTAATASLERSVSVNVKTRAAMPDASAQPASNHMRAMQMQPRTVASVCDAGQLIGAATVKCEGHSGSRAAGPCATDISSLLANRLRAEADSDSPTDIVLPTIDTSLLPALDGGSINILSAATAMLPTADELNLNLDLAVCASDVLQQSG